MPRPKRELVAALEAPLAGHHDVAGQQAVGVLVGNVVAVERARNLARVPAPGPRRGFQEPAEAADAFARYEAEGRVEVALHLAVGAEDAPRVVGQVELPAPCPVLARGRGETLQDERRDGQVPVTPQVGGLVQEVVAVQAGRVAVFGRAPRGDQADRRLPAHVALHADDAEVLARHRVALLRLDAQQAQAVLADAAAELAAADQIDRLAVVRNADAPAEEGNDDQRSRGRRQPVHREIRRVLQEELPLFREEQREARQVDLRVVDLGFGEVGVQRQAQREPGREFVEQVEARLERRGVTAHLGRQKR